MGYSRFVFSIVGAITVEAGLAQTERFEVAVIRATQAATTTGTSFNLFESGRIRMTNEPVKLLIRVAFGLENSQIVGGPGWVDSDRFDVEAKTGRGEKPKPEELRPMMRELLRDRFHLKFHMETREAPVYALVVGKNGPKLKAAAEDETSGMNTTTGGTSRAVAVATTMELLAGYVANRVGRTVLDKTGLKGRYDFTLEWAPERGPDAAAPALTTALREQLGLALESQKAPVEVLVIDSIERPSEN